MNDQNNRFSKMACAGLIMTVSAPILSVLFMRYGYSLNRVVKLHYVYDVLLLFCTIVLPFAGRTFAIIGLVSSIKNKIKGKGMAITGIVLGELELIIDVLFCVFLLLFWIYGDSRDPVDRIR